MATVTSFDTRKTLAVGDRSVSLFSLNALEGCGFPRPRPLFAQDPSRNLLRCEDDRFVKAADMKRSRGGTSGFGAEGDLLRPARVLLQDFTGVPCVVDRGDARRLPPARRRSEPGQPAAACRLVIDHSVQVDYFGRASAFRLNAELEFSRNRSASVPQMGRTFRNFRVVPPDTGIVHR